MIQTERGVGYIFGAAVAPLEKNAEDVGGRAVTVVTVLSPP